MRQLCPATAAYTTIIGTQFPMQDQEPHASSATSATHGNTAANSQTVGGTPGERETEADDTNTATNTAPSTSSQDPLAPQANQSRGAEGYVSEY